MSISLHVGKYKYLKVLRIDIHSKNISYSGPFAFNKKVLDKVILFLNLSSIKR